MNSSLFQYETIDEYYPEYDFYSNSTGNGTCLDDYYVRQQFLEEVCWISIGTLTSSAVLPELLLIEIKGNSSSLTLNH